MKEVSFLPSDAVFQITYKGTESRAEELKNKVEGLIIFPGVRKFLGGVGDILNKS